MARSAEGAALSGRQRAAQLRFRARLLRDVTRLWSAVDPTNLAATIGPFAAAAAVLVRAANRQAAGLATGYLRAFRRAEQVPGRPDVRLAEPPPHPVASAALRGAALAGIIAARRAGRSPQAAAQTGLARTFGAATSLMLDGARRTVIAAAAADPHAAGWQRITSADPCSFCGMLAARGAAFGAETSAGFEAHDHCSCTVEVAYPGSRPPATSQKLQALWETATSGLTGRQAAVAFRQAIEGRADPAA